jgi:hypothetical protein
MKFRVALQRNTYFRRAVTVDADYEPHAKPTMKYCYYLSLFALLLLLSNVKSNAQCFADAGPDTAICTNPFDTLRLGGQPTATGGAPPYSYVWQASYSVGSATWTASDFLNDTTLANPEIIYPGPDEITFNLTVTDSLGNTCTDSVHIQFSWFGFTLEDKRRVIHQGDSVGLYPGVFGNIAPFTYQWSPNYNLSNPNSAFPIAWPDTSTSYVVTITDSAGCTVVDPDAFDVIVIPLSLDESSMRPEIRVFPNPTSTFVHIEYAGPQSGRIEVHISDIYGRLVLQTMVTEELTAIDVRNLAAGVYFYQLRNNRSSLASGRFVIR